MPNVSIAEINRLRECERILNEMRESKHMQPFVKTFVENMGLVIANMPTERWPDWVQGCFKNAQLKYPIGAELYARRMESMK